MVEFNFSPASLTEMMIHGAQRPGYPSTSDIAQDVANKWVRFMRGAGVRRVVCLLGEEQLAYYSFGLLDYYREAFGVTGILHAPVADYHLCHPDVLANKILPFLRASDQAGEKAVVHCSGGSGRTGHVLAAWLVYGRGLALALALEEVKKLGNREPREAVYCGNATEEDLVELFRRAGDARGQKLAKT